MAIANGTVESPERNGSGAEAASDTDEPYALQSLCTSCFENVSSALACVHSRQYSWPALECKTAGGDQIATYPHTALQGGNGGLIRVSTLRLQVLQLASNSSLLCFLISISCSGCSAILIKKQA